MSITSAVLSLLCILLTANSVASQTNSPFGPDVDNTNIKFEDTFDKCLTKLSSEHNVQVQCALKARAVYGPVFDPSDRSKNGSDLKNYCCGTWSVAACVRDEARAKCDKTEAEALNKWLEEFGEKRIARLNPVNINNVNCFKEAKISLDSCPKSPFGPFGASKWSWIPLGKASKLLHNDTMQTCLKKIDDWSNVYSKAEKTWNSLYKKDDSPVDQKEYCCGAWGLSQLVLQQAVDVGCSPDAKSALEKFFGDFSSSQNSLNVPNLKEKNLSPDYCGHSTGKPDGSGCFLSPLPAGVFQANSRPLPLDAKFNLVELTKSQSVFKCQSEALKKYSDGQSIYKAPNKPAFDETRFCSVIWSMADCVNNLANASASLKDWITSVGSNPIVINSTNGALQNWCTKCTLQEFKHSACKSNSQLMPFDKYVNTTGLQLPDKAHKCLQKIGTRDVANCGLRGRAIYGSVFEADTRLASDRINYCCGTWSGASCVLNLAVGSCDKSEHEDLKNWLSQVGSSPAYRLNPLNWTEINGMDCFDAADLTMKSCPSPFGPSFNLTSWSSMALGSSVKSVFFRQSNTCLKKLEDKHWKQVYKKVESISSGAYEATAVGTIATKPIEYCCGAWAVATYVLLEAENLCRDGSFQELKSFFKEFMSPNNKLDVPDYSTQDVHPNYCGFAYRQDGSGCFEGPLPDSVSLPVPLSDNDVKVCLVGLKKTGASADCQRKALTRYNRGQALIAKGVREASYCQAVWWMAECVAARASVHCSHNQSQSLDKWIKTAGNRTFSVVVNDPVYGNKSQQWCRNCSLIDFKTGSCPSGVADVRSTPYLNLSYFASFFIFVAAYLN